MAADKNPQYCACIHTYTHIQPLLYLITMWILHDSFLLVATMPSHFLYLISIRLLQIHSSVSSCEQEHHTFL